VRQLNKALESGRYRVRKLLNQSIIWSALLLPAVFAKKIETVMSSNPWWSILPLKTQFSTHFEFKKIVNPFGRLAEKGYNCLR
jgi:hypothetical protein